MDFVIIDISQQENFEEKEFSRITEVSSFASIAMALFISLRYVFITQGTEGVRFPKICINFETHWNE